MSNKINTSDMRIKRTRKFILDALLSLMDEKGFEHVSVSDLTKRADINRVTFYLHYQDKYDLLDKVITEKLNELKKEVYGSFDSNPTDFYKVPGEPVITIFENIYKNYDFYKVMLGKNTVPYFVTSLERLLAKITEIGLNRVCPNCQDNIVNRNVYLAYASSAQVGVIKYWIQNGMNESPRNLANQLIQITKLGIQVWGINLI